MKRYTSHNVSRSCCQTRAKGFVRQHVVAIRATAAPVEQTQTAADGKCTEPIANKLPCSLPTAMVATVDHSTEGFVLSMLSQVLSQPSRS